MTDHGEESEETKNVPLAQPESFGKRLHNVFSQLRRPENIGEKLRNAASELGQFFVGAGIAVATLGVLTGVIVLVLLGIKKFF